MARKLFLILCLSLLLSACSSSTPQPTATLEPTAAPLPSRTPAPTVTATTAPTLTVPPATATLPPTQTLPLLPSPSSTPAAAFDQLQIIAIDNAIGGYMVVLKIPGIHDAYTMMLANREYTCQVDAKTPDRLFCQGLSSPPLDQSMSVAFIDPATHNTVFQGNTLVPSALFIKPTQKGYANTNCPERGQNVKCETECRIDPKGNPCIMATCVDKCGAYFSVNGCPDNMSLDYASCTPEQWKYMKARYGIP